ncbi:MAG TPA: GumC family protein [Terriglobales bacterium]|jgi:uncharacterized protein involved in exopolysaccharide biosynthesis|nr:GumC family protein [Terriglobales bacterium]
MSEALLLTTKNDEMRSYTARELVSILFRHRRPATICFLLMLGAAVIAAFVLPAYEAEMKFLVKRERVDPVITGDQSPSQIQVASSEITEQEMNSEAELLTSEDLLRQVVLASHLEGPGSSSWLHKDNPERRIAVAVRKLRSHLRIEPVRKANIINVTLSSRDPQQAARILDSLANFYLEKHAKVNRPGGQSAFFEQQTDSAKKDLAGAEAKLQVFNQQQRVVAPELERDNTLQKLADMTLALEQTKAAVDETQDRIRTLEKLQSSTPSRMTTQLRRGDNPQLMQQLKSTLLTLQLKRTELLTKYQPAYPLVQEVDNQIAATQASIDAENARPVREEVTDQNPTNQWIRSELAKARADYSGLKARELATQASVSGYESRARLLGDKGIVQQELLRSAKAAEQNYLLYLRKREESRITDALDRRRILNVAVAQEPIAPALPARSGSWYLLVGMLCAVFAAVGITFIAEYFDDSFRTPEEMRRELSIPVIAAIPFCPALRLTSDVASAMDTGKEMA